MKPILPSRPNHSWLRRRFREAMRGFLRGSDEGSDAALRWSSGQANSGYAGLMNALDLKNRTAVVTGGAAGIGLAISQRLAASGARVSLWDRDEKALAEGAKALGNRTHTVRVDVADETDVCLARDEAIRDLGKVDILVCSAGITGPNLTTWDYPLAD